MMFVVSSGCRRFDDRERIAVFLQRVQQARLRIENISCNRRIARVQAERFAAFLRKRAVEFDFAQMIERPLVDGDGDVDARALWHSVEIGREARVCQHAAVDRDTDLVEIVAEAVQCGLQARNVVARARDERKWRNRNLLTQGNQLRT